MHTPKIILTVGALRSVCDGSHILLLRGWLGSARRAACAAVDLQKENIHMINRPMRAAIVVAALSLMPATHADVITING